MIIQQTQKRVLVLFLKVLLWESFSIVKIFKVSSSLCLQFLSRLDRQAKVDDSALILLVEIRKDCIRQKTWSPPLLKVSLTTCNNGY